MICELQNRLFIHHSRHFMLQSCDFFNEVKAWDSWGGRAVVRPTPRNKLIFQRVRLVSVFFKHHILKIFTLLHIFLYHN